MNHPQLVKFRFDSESGALYTRIRDGRIAETLEVGPGAYLDIDSEGYVMGAEFLSLEEMGEFIERLGGTLELPERVEDPKHFRLLPA